ncbi:MAG: PHP-associated domain-containing protein [Desulfobacterales bacterium]
MKIDLHLHTIYGSSCAYMEPEQLIACATKIGLGGICITEHDQVWGEERIADLNKKHDLLIIGGVEVSTDLGEVLVFGFHESVMKISTAANLRERVDAVGGVMIPAHPFRLEPDMIQAHVAARQEDPDTPTEQFLSAVQRPLFKLADAIEIYNGRSGRNEIAFATSVADYLGLKGTGGSDAHATIGVGACCTVFENTIADEAEFIGHIKEGLFHGIDERWEN